MQINQLIQLELIKAICAQKKNSVKIEEQLRQENLVKYKTKSYTVKLESSTLVLS